MSSGGKLFIPFTSAIILALLIAVFPQNKISDKREELEGIQSEIRKIEKEINAAASREKKTYALIQKYDRQIHLIDKVLSELRREERKKDKAIQFTERKISELQNSIETLQHNYGLYVVAVYKGLVDDEIFYLLDAKSLRQAMLRYRYFRELSRSGRETKEQITVAKNELERSRAVLIAERKEKQRLIAEKKSEEKRFKNKISRRKSYLSELRNDKAALIKDLEVKRDAQKKIQALINKLIEEARRREEETGRKLYATENFKAVAPYKGQLSWPVDGGTVIRKFGQNTNAKLNTVSINYGIDIKVNSAASVRCIAEGVVSAIEWIPGYGSVVIINHRDDYRTVYGHLSEIYTVEGNRLQAGDVIGVVGESLDGFVLHFEMWNKRNNLNPQSWLRRK